MEYSKFIYTNMPGIKWYIMYNMEPGRYNNNIQYNSVNDSMSI